MDLLELALVGVHGEANEALRAESLGDRSRVRFRLAVVRELEVRIGGHRRGTGIAHVQHHVDDIASPLEGVTLAHFEPVLPRGDELYRYLVAAWGERALSRLGAPQRAVVRSAFAGEAALRFVLTLGAQEDEVLGKVLGVLVAHKLHTLQSPSERVDLGHDEVRAHAYEFALCRFGAGDSNRGFGGWRRRLGRRGYARLLRRRGGWRLRALLLLPCFPKHEKREAEDYEENQPLRIHGLRDGIVTAGMPGAAAAYAPRREPAAAPEPVSQQRFLCVA